MILFITGAGISAPSGVPTYRGQENSLYNDKELMTLMSKESLTNNFNNLKIHLEQWKDFIQTKTFNEAHSLITELCNKYDGYVITQNVDNFHELSGLPEDRLYHIHGSLFEQRNDREASKLLIEISEREFKDKKGFDLKKYLVNELNY